MERPFNMRVAKLRAQLCHEFMQTGEINPIIMSELQAYLARRALGQDAPALPNLNNPVSSWDQLSPDGELPRVLLGQAGARQVAPTKKKRKPKRRPSDPDYIKCCLPTCNNLTKQQGGYCPKHYIHAAYQGKLPPARKGRPPKIPALACSVAECNLIAHCRGLCHRHHAEYLAKGKLPFMRLSKNISLQWLEELNQKRDAKTLQEGI